MAYIFVCGRVCGIRVYIPIEKTCSTTQFPVRIRYLSVFVSLSDNTQAHTFNLIDTRGITKFLLCAMRYAREINTNQQGQGQQIY